MLRQQLARERMGGGSGIPRTGAQSSALQLLHSAQCVNDFAVSDPAPLE